MLQAESSILARMIDPRNGSVPRSLARQMLDLQFSDKDHARMRLLSQKANEGELSASEKRELENFISISHLLALLHAKARLSLKKRSRAA